MQLRGFRRKDDKLEVRYRSGGLQKALTTQLIVINTNVRPDARITSKCAPKAVKNRQLTATAPNGATRLCPVGFLVGEAVMRYN